MKSLFQNKILLIALVIVLGIGIWFWFFRNGDVTVPAETTNVVEENEQIGSEVQAYLNTIRAVRLDSSFLMSATISSLEDLRLFAVPVNAGRTNPFSVYSSSVQDRVSTTRIIDIDQE